MYIEISHSKAISLTKQIYNAIRSRILNNELKGHERLPSSRVLAKKLGVSRIIVVEVYEQLAAEGFVYTHKGSGTYVNDGIVYKGHSQQVKSTHANNTMLYASPKDVISFRPGVPDLKTIPVNQWARIYSNTVKDIKKEYLDYHNPFGCIELRNSLVTYLYRSRGVKTSTKNIMITTGVAQAISLLKFLLNKEDYVLIEDPSSKGLQETLKINGINYRGIELDNQGLIIEKLPKKPPKFIFTTPSHQFPTGVILTIKRRIALVQYAKKHNIYLVEDDYDSEFRFNGSPIQSLQSIEPNRTIYFGTFSKIFSPAIRMGYMILPDKMIMKMEKAKYGTDIHSPILEQLAMARFIDEGYLEKHIRKMNKIYAARRQRICDLAVEKFADQVMIKGDHSGLHLILSFPNISYSNKEILEAMVQNKVDIWTLDQFRVSVEKRTSVNSYDEGVSFILGYGNLDEEDIIKGMDRLEEVVYYK